MERLIKPQVISTGRFSSVGITNDGRIKLKGVRMDTKHFESLGDSQTEATNWTDMIAVSVGIDHVVGIKKDFPLFLLCIQIIWNLMKTNHPIERLSQIGRILLLFLREAIILLG